MNIMIQTILMWTRYIYSYTCICIYELKTIMAAAVVQWIRAFAPQAEGWVLESQLQQI